MDFFLPQILGDYNCLNFSTFVAPTEYMNLPAIRQKTMNSPRSFSLPKAMGVVVFSFLLVFSTLSYGQGSELVKLDRLQNMINTEQQVQVINFWATWCAPCIKELPLFEKLNLLFASYPHPS